MQTVDDSSVGNLIDKIVNRHFKEMSNLSKIQSKPETRDRLP